MLVLSDLGVSEDEGRRRAEAAIADGTAVERFGRWISAQGGHADAALAGAPVVRPVEAPRDGVVTRLGAIAIGIAALDLGAGRRTKDDTIDHAVGVECLSKRGDPVREGQRIAVVHARTEDAATAAADAVLAAYEFGDEAPSTRPIVLETLA
jgi:thymidine phosphorylase